MSQVSGRTTHMLSEPDAADLLASHGIPYVEHGTAATAEAAVVVATRLGYPVVLKVVSPDIIHKTEAGGVVLGLKDEGALRAGFDELLGNIGTNCPEARLDGVLVARHVTARRELIIGATHDPTFGPTVMVGLGGIFAEALEDVVFRVAPMRQRDGLSMLSELRAARLLDAFRGEPPIDRAALADILVEVGDLLLGHPEFGEIDLNPVAASADGCVVLDARIMVHG